MPGKIATRKASRNDSRRPRFNRFASSRADAHRLQPRNLQPRSLQIEMLETRWAMSATTPVHADPALLAWFDSHVD